MPYDNSGKFIPENERVGKKESEALEERARRKAEAAEKGKGYLPPGVEVEHTRSSTPSPNENKATPNTATTPLKPGVDPKPEKPLSEQEKENVFKKFGLK